LLLSEHDDRDISVRGAVLRFLLSGLLAFALVAGLAAFALRRAATSEAVVDARRLTRLAGEGIVEPNLLPGIERASSASRRRLDKALVGSRLPIGLVRIKLWTSDGLIVYSDEPRLIGDRYELGEDDKSVLRSGAVEAELSDLSRPENRFERTQGELLEVYMPIEAPSGEKLLFETYLRSSGVVASGRAVWLTMAPGLIASLALLEVIQLPLAWRMARRLRHRQEERERLMQAAIESSENERRRIASDLHDGAVQQLAGIAMSLSGVEPNARKLEDPLIADTIARAASGTRESMRQLRTLLVELYPPNLEAAGLGAALRQLSERLTARGLTVNLDIPEQLEVPRRASALLYRAAQEGVRNIISHAEAAKAEIALETTDGMVRLSIEDDGKGMSKQETSKGRRQGHLGLPLLRNLFEESGGSVKIESRASRGTRMDAEIPCR
jgi:two-component system, NarL family, sensor kinase